MGIRSDKRFNKIRLSFKKKVRFYTGLSIIHFFRECLSLIIVVVFERYALFDTAKIKDVYDFDFGNNKVVYMHQE